MRWWFSSTDLDPVIDRIDAALAALIERTVQMATRADIDAAKAELAKDIADLGTRVSNDIQALRQQIANGDPVTDQDLADLQADIQAVTQIDPAQPAPTPPSP